jgi:HrpA-like RNA helicase
MSDGPRISAKNQEKVLDSVTHNRVTIIVGATGSGKSTLVPPLLLDRLPQCQKKPVLCSQPRRLAVVAISKRVAQTRGCDDHYSGEIGYQVGNQNVSTKNTRLLFTTAGILLETMRANGVSTLTKYGCIIIDECHERSPESDLSLALIKQFCKFHPKEEIRIVLMSATFDSNRYKRFFHDVPGCSNIDIIPLETAQAFAAFYDQVQDFYMEDIISQLPQNGVVQTLMRSVLKDPNEDLHHEHGKEISPNLLFFIYKLVEWLDEQEPQEAPFLIFAPTYRHLEQIHTNLDGLPNLRLHVLHSSVDMEDCLRSMQPGLTTQTAQRRVLLASAIADSSVTVPGVTCVIDMCRALEVRWDADINTYIPRTVWASKSICTQRRGRTGRTCAGRVFRLIPKGFYISKLEEWDTPQLSLSSCQNEVLSLVTSKTKIDPRTLLLGTCMDMPEEEVVEAAIGYLKKIGACEAEFVRGRMQLQPTTYGMLMAALPLDVKDSKILLAGASLGLLYETLALRAICNHKPSPIVHYFGERERNFFNLISYYPYYEQTDPTSGHLANLAAYMHWDAEWNSKRANRTKQEFRERTVPGSIETVHIWKWTEELEAEHISWCKDHEINPTAVRSIAELIETTIHVFYQSQFEPEWLRCCNPTPVWKRPSAWRGPQAYGRCMIQRVYGNSETLCQALAALCNSQFRVASQRVHEMHGILSKQPARTKLTEERQSKGPMACIHFLAGRCKYGSKCRSAHSYKAPRPPCRFNQQGFCSKGDSCLFAHAETDDEFAHGIPDGQSSMDAVVPLLPHLSLQEDPMGWFQANHTKLLLLGEGDFKFAAALKRMHLWPVAASTNHHLSSELLGEGYWDGLDATRIHADTRVLQRLQHVRSFAWNFPLAGSIVDVDHSENENMLLATFLSLSLLLDTAWSELQVEELNFAVSLQGDQFSRWLVLRSAWRTGWELIGWSEFDWSQFRGYKPSRQNGNTFPAEYCRFYVFSLKRKI